MVNKKIGTRWGKIIRNTFIAGAITVFIHIVHAATLDRMIEYKEVPFYSPNVPAEMNGYRIAFISDIHELAETRLRKAAEELNKKNVDLLLLGGDYLSNGEAPLQMMEILSQITTTDGIYGVEGTHDNYLKSFTVMEELDITPLSNSGLHLRDYLYLAGVEDMNRRKPDISRAIEGALPEDFVLLVSHKPDVTMTQGTDGVDLILCGHTHGGHITFFGVLAPALIPKAITRYGHRFMSGWSASRDGVPVYVSRGIGSFAWVPRIFARPQVILITLYLAQ